MDTKTPLTDALVKSFKQGGLYRTQRGKDIVTFDDAIQAHARRMERDRARLMKALDKCCKAIYDEVNAAGEPHPTIDRHQRVADDAIALLAELKA